MSNIQFEETEYSITSEKKILTALITSDDFLAEFADKYDKTFFREKYSRIVTSWCLSHYEKCNKAPNVHIMDLYDSAIVSKQLKQAELQMIDKLLENMSDDFPEDSADSGLQTEYLIKQCADLQIMYKADELQSQLELAIENNSADEVLELVSKYSEETVLGDTGVGDGIEVIDVFDSKDRLKEIMFSESGERLISFSGDSSFLNPFMVRGGLFSIRATQKSGKSFALYKLALKLLLAGHNVLIAECGDLTIKDMFCRLISCMSGLPTSEDDIEREVWTWVCKSQADDTCPASHRFGHGVNLLDEDGNIDPDKIPENFQRCQHCLDNNIKNRFKARIYPKKVISKGYLTSEFLDNVFDKFKDKFKDKLKVISVSAGMVNDKYFDKLLTSLAKDGWVADALITDYNLLYKPLDTKERNKVMVLENQAKASRALSKKFNLLYITAEQLSRASTSGSNAIGMNSSYYSAAIDFYITGAIGVVAPPHLRTRGMSINNVILARSVAFDDSQFYMFHDYACARWNCECLKKKHIDDSEFPELAQEEQALDKPVKYIPRTIKQIEAGKPLPVG